MNGEFTAKNVTSFNYEGIFGVYAIDSASFSFDYYLWRSENNAFDKRKMNK